VLVESQGRSGKIKFAMESQEYSDAFTFPSVTPRSVSSNSSHFSTPASFLISSSHPMANSTSAWTAPFSCPCFLLNVVMLEFNIVQSRAAYVCSAMAFTRRMVDARSEAYATRQRASVDKNTFDAHFWWLSRARTVCPSLPVTCRPTGTGQRPLWPRTLGRAP
jgi:hypothetical protein